MSHEPDILIKDFFSGEAKPQDAEAFEAWLRKDPANIKTLAEFVMLDGLLLNAQKNADAQAILSSLLDAEQNAPLTLVDVTPCREPMRDLGRLEDDPISFRQLFSLAGYMAGKGLRKPAFMKAAAAAIFVLAASLMLILALSGPSQQRQSQPNGLATTLGQSDDATLASALATLTAVHNARWGERELVPGSILRLDQRLTLTAGFAEITTKRGAIAIIQAPATVEILGPNRITLSRGTLIGRCPTVASRGFTVDTPTAQVVDVGTRFGVAVDTADETVLEVFTGEVLFSSVVEGEIEPATRVVSGQSAHLDRGEVVLTPTTGLGDSRFKLLAVFEYDRLMNTSPLIAHYGFDQPGDRSLRESRGEIQFDAEIGGATWVQGRTPDTHALSFTGERSEERVVLSQEASDQLKLRGDFTIAMWVNVRDLQHGGWSAIVTKGNDSWRFLGSRNKKTGQPQIGFYWSQGKEKPDVNFAGAVSQDVELGRWHHLVVTGQSQGDGQGVTTRLYLDGVLKADTPFPHNNHSNSPVMFGATTIEKGIRGFNGMLGETTFWNQALEEEEIHTLYIDASLPRDKR